MNYSATSTTTTTKPQPFGRTKTALGTHLFNFRTPLQEEDHYELMNYFGSSFYTNDPEYVAGSSKTPE
jgi:hypothetical protein